MINETLVAAAQYMDEHGKATGSYLDDKTGSVCMVGALRMTILNKNLVSGLEEADRLETYEAATTHLAQYALDTLVGDGDDDWGEYEYDPLSAVFFLNDTRHQTKEETVKFMLEAAEWEPSSDR